jgi:hypothetical protein
MTTVKKTTGFASALASGFSMLMLAAVLGSPLPVSAQTVPDAAGPRPVDLARPETRVVRVEVARRVLMGTSAIVDMGFDPALPAEFSSDGTTATVRVRGADVTVVAPLFDPLMAGPANAAITDARFVMQGDLVLSIDVATGATEVEQSAMGMAVATVRIGALTVLDREPLSFGVRTRGSTARGPLKIATIGTPNPTGGAPVLINGAACAPAGSAFERDAMVFGLASCGAQIMVGGQPTPQFTNQVSIDPMPFDRATGTVVTVGNQVVALGAVLGMQLPEAIRFNRDLSAFRISESAAD